MKFTRFIAVVVAATICGGPLSVALADHLPTQERHERKVVPMPAQMKRVVTAQAIKVVPAPYRQHHHPYVEVPRYCLECVGFICLQKAIGYRHQYVQAHHDYGTEDN